MWSFECWWRHWSEQLIARAGCCGWFCSSSRTQAQLLRSTRALSASRFWGTSAMFVRFHWKWLKSAAGCFRPSFCCQRFRFHLSRNRWDWQTSGSHWARSRDGSSHAVDSPGLCIGCRVAAARRRCWRDRRSDTFESKSEILFLNIFSGGWKSCDVRSQSMICFDSIPNTNLITTY